MSRPDARALAAAALILGAAAAVWSALITLGLAAISIATVALEGPTHG